MIAIMMLMPIMIMITREQDHLRDLLAHPADHQQEQGDSPCRRLHRGIPSLRQGPERHHPLCRTPSPLDEPRCVRTENFLVEMVMWFMVWGGMRQFFWGWFGFVFGMCGRGRNTLSLPVSGEDYDDHFIVILNVDVLAFRKDWGWLFFVVVTIIIFIILIIIIIINVVIIVPAKVSGVIGCWLHILIWVFLSWVWILILICNSKCQRWEADWWGGQRAPSRSRGCTGECQLWRSVFMISHL